MGNKRHKASVRKGSVAQGKPQIRSKKTSVLEEITQEDPRVRDAERQLRAWKIPLTVQAEGAGKASLARIFGVVIPPRPSFGNMGGKRRTSRGLSIEGEDDVPSQYVNRDVIEALNESGEDSFPDSLTLTAATRFAR